MQYKVKSRQSLLDVALITCGSSDAAFELAQRNNVSITDDLAPGTILEYLPDDITNKKVVETLAAYRSEPATAISQAND